ncbi:hypothetical protein RJE46_24575 (plasmid) [Cedecea neteri]|uniref:hypothetical protein n=1 Tax=Cedecea neteri TaxID=158822 RepID=UPI0028929A80|nr:hypothetical protein [Cedecea neteri]WNJ82253.1 hypothetical protein RJE46_24575 [Cedecea neteri]
MHTRNVNVKTAAQESTERWGQGEKHAPLRTDGFVRNLHSSNPFDVVRADSLIQRMEKQANAGCGLHYEIYESRLLGLALDYLCNLPLKDRPVFMGAASLRGIILTLAEEEKAKEACDELMAMIQAED